MANPDVTNCMNQMFDERGCDPFLRKSYCVHGIRSTILLKLSDRQRSSEQQQLSEGSFGSRQKPSNALPPIKLTQL